MVYENWRQTNSELLHTRHYKLEQAAKRSLKQRKAVPPPGMRRLTAEELRERLLWERCGGSEDGI